MAQDIYIKFKGDSSQLLGQIRKIESRLSGLNGRVSKATGGLNKMERSTRGVGNSLNTAGTALRGFIGALGVRELLNFGDSVQKINNRLALINPALGTAEQNFNRILGIANRTQQPLSATADLFQKVARSADQYGLSAGQVTGVTETFTNLLRLAGADAGTAAGAITQFAQALGSGTLRGDELNSVIEATSGEILPILAKELGVSAGQVRQLAQDGKITADVLLNALGKSADEVGDKVGGMGTTIGGALTIFYNNLLALGRDTTPVFNAIAQGILFLGENLQRLASYAAAGIIVWGGYRAALIAANVANLIFVGGLKAIRGALIRTGIGALIVGLGEAIYRFGQLSERVGGFANALGFLKAYASEVWSRISQGMSLVGEEAWYVGQAIKNAFGSAIAWVVRKFANFTQTMIDGYNAVLEVFGMDPTEGKGLGTGLADALEADLAQSQETLGYYRDSLNKSWSALFDPMQTTVEKFNRENGIEIITDDLEDFGEEAWQTVEPVEALGEAGKKMADDIAAAIEEFKGIPDALDIVKGGIDAFNRLNPLKGLSRTYKTELAGLETLRNKDLINEEEYLKTKAQLHKDYAEEIGEIQRNQYLESFKDAGVSNAAILDAVGRSYENIQKIQQGGVAGAIGLADEMGSIFSTLGQHNRKAFEMAKKFNIASALMNTALAATKAFATVPPPFNFLAAGAVIAAGAAQIAMIRSQSFSGRALGGPVMGGTPYMVGENGPEMFMPAQSGSITRNDQLGGGENVNVNFTINAVDARGIDQLLIERKSVITSIISDAMLERGTRSAF
tara:strand:+ start:2031 stop:4418 length:2388 start_codon:yes stop_codon:yes gene_type:complete